MKPDTCTSINCNNYGCDYCQECSHASFFGNGVDERGKKWRWVFKPIIGPFFLRKDGEEMKRQPVEGGHAWKTFKTWHKKRYGKDWQDKLLKY